MLRQATVPKQLLMTPEILTTCQNQKTVLVTSHEGCVGYATLVIVGSSKAGHIVRVE
jgi:hypothetical protein